MPSSSLTEAECRLAARRSIARLRAHPGATIDIATGQTKRPPDLSAVDRLALHHLGDIARELQDEVRAFLSTGVVDRTGIASFLLPAVGEDGRELDESGRGAALARLLEQCKSQASSRLTALRRLDEAPRREEEDDDEYEKLLPTTGGNATFTVVPRIAGFGGIRDYSEQMSGRRSSRPPPEAASKERRVVIVEEDERKRSPSHSPFWDEEEEESIDASAMLSPSIVEEIGGEDIERIAKLTDELSRDPSFMATFRRGDPKATEREAQRRWRREMERGPVSRPTTAPAQGGRREDLGGGGGGEDRRGGRGQGPLPLLESTPLKGNVLKGKAPLASPIPSPLVTPRAPSRGVEKRETGTQVVKSSPSPSLRSLRESSSAVDSPSSHGISIGSDSTPSVGQISRGLLAEVLQRTVIGIIDVGPEDFIGEDRSADEEEEEEEFLDLTGRATPLTTMRESIPAVSAHSSIFGPPEAAPTIPQPTPILGAASPVPRPRTNPPPSSRPSSRPLSTPSVERREAPGEDALSRLSLSSPDSLERQLLEEAAADELRNESTGLRNERAGFDRDGGEGGGVKYRMYPSDDDEEDLDTLNHLSPIPDV